MTAATINKINAAIQEFGVAVHKGNGYFYFYDTGEAFVADSIPSVYSMTLRCMPLEEWVAHVKDAVAE
jgi:hypothetical protein